MDAAKDGFVHLHVHSHYSLLDGANRIAELVEAAQAHGASALGLTDHGNLFGAIEFYSAVAAAGVKPILGMEAYISPTSRFDKSMGNISTAAYHLLLLAMNRTGWQNLIKLSSRAYIEGFYYRPRIDMELLGELNEGLICTTACLKGQVPAALLANQPKHAHRITADYLDIFGPDRLFIEIQNHLLPEQEQINGALVALGKEFSIPLVGTNDVHFLRRDSKSAHEVLTCISTGKTLADRSAMTYSPELYFKSPAEMRQVLKDFPGAADNTLKIAEMCNLKLNFSAKHLPSFTTPEGTSPQEYLRRLALEGLRRRFGSEARDEHRARLDRELKVIEQKGYSSYVLIVHDFVQYTKDNGIPCGARGSGCATLLGYCLGISDVDPMRYGLLFERFTDPQRDEDPDFDIDICQEGRAKIIQYVREKYGHVAQIITFGTLKARAAVRDVGRVMDIPLSEVDAIAKKIPEALGITLQGALVGEPDLRRMYESDPRVHQLIEHGMELEGLARHAGVHAAGIVVADEPLENLVPLYRSAKDSEPITQWDGPTCSKIGLMKMDFLGLRTLTTIQRARELVHDRLGRDIDPATLPLDGQEVLELFRRGQTDGVFQFESDGMKNVLTQMQPTRIEDLIAANAMFRPGPMELIGTYCARKAGREKVLSIHPLVDDILAETYGIMIYQEQVMQVLNRLGKLPLSTALTLIKAISKKKEKVIAAERPNFLDGAKENGIDHDEAEALFELILKFAGYGFNKAHSTRYAIIAYQTAYFKAYYPREFIAALLTFESGETDKVVKYLAEAKRMGIQIGPPDINLCDSDFTVDGEQVRFGLAAVKGVGARAVEAISRARSQVKRFTDLYHLCRHVDLRAVNRATIEALIKCGAFDSLGAHRAAMSAALNHAIELGQAADDDRRSGQMSLFSAGGTKAPAPRFPQVEPWSEAQLLTAEKETLGFYITSHPLSRYGRELSSLSQPAGVSLARLAAHNTAAPVTIGCTVASIRPTVAKTGRSAGKKMAMITVEDLTGKCEGVVFPEVFGRIGELLKPDAIAFIVGSLDTRRDRPCIIVEDLIPIDTAIEQLTGRIVLRLSAKGTQPEFLRRLHDVLARHRGPCPTLIELRPAGHGEALVAIQLDRDWFTQPTRQLVDELAELLGEENLLLQPKQLNNRANGRRFARKPNHRQASQPLSRSARV